MWRKSCDVNLGGKANTQSNGNSRKERRISAGGMVLGGLGLFAVFADVESHERGLKMGEAIASKQNGIAHSG